MAAIRLALAAAAWSRDFEDGDERAAEGGAARLVEVRAASGLAIQGGAAATEGDDEAALAAVGADAALGGPGAVPLRASRERIEALLRAKKLDGTLASGEREDEAARAARVARLAPTGWAAIDTRLGGGFPRGECSEIVGARSTGRTSVLCALLAGAAARGEIVALVDACDRFDPVSASGFGLDLDRLLWVRGFSPEPEPAPAPVSPVRASSALASSALASSARVSSARSSSALGSSSSRRASGEEAERQARRLDRAIKAFGLILQAGGFGIVALDLADVPEPAVRRLPFTTWRRLQRLVERSETVGLLLAAEPLGRSARGVTLRLSAAEGGRHLIWSGTSDQARLFTGFAFQPQVHSARRLGDEADAEQTSRARVAEASTGETLFELWDRDDQRHTGTRG